MKLSALHEDRGQVFDEQALDDIITTSWRLALKKSEMVLGPIPIIATHIFTTSSGKSERINFGCYVRDAQETADLYKDYGIQRPDRVAVAQGTLEVNGEAIRPGKLNKEFGVALSIYRHPRFFTYQWNTEPPEDFRRIVGSIIDHELGHLLRDVNDRQRQGIETHRQRIGAPFGLSDEVWSREIGEPYRTINQISPGRYPLTLPDELDANAHSIISAFSRLPLAKRDRLSYRALVQMAAPQALQRFDDSRVDRIKLIRLLWRNGVRLRQVR